MTKLFIFLFVLSLICIIKELFFFVQALLYTKDKYITNSKRVWLLGLSIAYIFTTIFTGFSI